MPRVTWLHFRPPTATGSSAASHTGTAAAGLSEVESPPVSLDPRHSLSQRQRHGRGGMETSYERTRRINEERAERERDYAWFHIACDADEFGDDHRMWPGRPLADVASHLDRLFEHAYLGEADKVSETELLAALLV